MAALCVRTVHCHRLSWVAVVLSLLLLGTPTVFHVPSTHSSTYPPPAVGSAAMVDPSHRSSPSPLGGCPTPVAETYVAANRSSSPCNALPANGNAPDALAIDSAAGELYVGFGLSPYVGVLNTTTASLTRFLPIPGAAAALAFDPVNGLLYAAVGGTVIAINVATGRVVATPVNSTGSAYDALSVDPATGTVFAADAAGDTVAMINGSTNSIIATVLVGMQPVALEFYVPTGNLYVADYAGSAVSVLTPSQQAVTATISLPGPPLSLAAEGDIGQVYVSTASTTYFLTASTGQINQSIPVGGVLGIDASLEYLYVACACYAAPTPGSALGYLHAYDLATSQYVGNVSVGATPDAIAVDTTTSVAFSANFDANNVTEVVPLPVRSGASVDLGYSPESLLTPANGVVFTSLAKNLAVEAISEPTGTLLATRYTGVDPGAMSSAPSSNLSYVVEGTRSLGVFNVATDGFTGYLPLPGAVRPAGVLPQADIAVDPSNGLAYVTDPQGSTVNMVAVSTGLSRGTIHVGISPGGITYDPALNELFVANCITANVTIVDASTNLPIGSVALPAASCPSSILYDLVDHQVYVAESASNSVVVLGGTGDRTVVGTVTVGRTPDALALDSNTGAVYVANRDSGTVMAVVPAGVGFAVGSTFPVGLLPTGLSYDPGSDTLFVANLGSGTVSFIPAPPTSPLYSVRFQESGLPVGDSWSITLANATVSSRGSSLSYLEPNGTYNFSVLPPNAYAATPTSGTTTVGGAGKVITIAFSPAGPRKFPVTFTERTLPTGATFTVIFNGTPGFVQATASGATLVFESVNGTWPYSVLRSSNYYPYPANASVVVAGFAPPAITIQFTPGAPEFLLSFRETGLPNATTWSVLVRTTTLSGEGGVLSRLEANGSYPYSVSTGVAFTPTPGSGYVTVHGASKIVNVTFAPNGSGSFARHGIQVLGIPLLEFSLAVGGAAVAAGVAALLLLRRSGRPGTDEEAPEQLPSGEAPPGAGDEEGAEAPPGPSTEDDDSAPPDEGVPEEGPYAPEEPVDLDPGSVDPGPEYELPLG